ncbi:MAG: alpha/beta hydrolase [Actinomycetota bacterium]
MPHATNGEISLCYEDHGNPNGPPLLLIPGLGMQLIDWPDHFLEHLETDYRVIRVDNRDRGLSTVLDGAPADAGALMGALLAGQEPEVAYTLPDMAKDAVAVLDECGVESAHVVGISMGGMIAQTVAIEHQDRVRSLTSIMSTTGAADVGQPSAAALTAILSAPTDPSREANIANGVESIRVWASPEFYDEIDMAESLGRSWDRVGGAQAEGTARQLCAIIATPARDDALAELDLPSAVLHGTEDKLIDPSGGERTAKCIPGAELLLLEGMGHDMPKEMTGRIASTIRDLVDAAEAGQEE